MKRLVIFVLFILSSFALVGCSDHFNGDKKDNFYITFMNDGEVFDRIKVYGASVFEYEKKPVKDGMIFDGWLLMGQVVEEGFVVDSSMVLVASFREPKILNIRYYVDGIFYDSVSVLEGDKISYIDAPVKDGYIFNGWYHSGVIWDFDSVITESIMLDAVYTDNTPYVSISEVLDLGYTICRVSGTVVAVNDNGFMIKDDSGVIYVSYIGNNLVVGDYVSVKGKPMLLANKVIMLNSEFVVTDCKDVHHDYKEIYSSNITEIYELKPYSAVMITGALEMTDVGYIVYVADFSFVITNANNRYDYFVGRNVRIIGYILNTGGSVELMISSIEILF